MHPMMQRLREKRDEQEPPKARPAPRDLTEEERRQVEDRTTFEKVRGDVLKFKGRRRKW